MKKQRIWIGIAVLLVLIASGCASKNANEISLSTETMEAVSNYESGYQKDFYDERNIEAEAMDMAVPELHKEDGGQMAAGAVTETPTLPAGRKLITEINMSMETTEIDLAVATVSNAIGRMGGYIESSSINGNPVNSYGELRSASMTARVPQNHLSEFLKVLEGSGNLLYKYENARDITLQYTDTEDRIKTLKIEQERLWELLGKAESIESIIILEQRLSEIRYELESYSSQLRTFDNQVDYATVYLNLSEVKIYTPQIADSIGQRISKGLKTNVNFISEAGVNLLVFVITHMPTFLVIAVFGVVIAVVIKKRAVKSKKEIKSGQNQKEHNEGN